MKAIDTSYAGCRFRSRTEARWAVFLDALDVPWEYEKEGFELPSGRYLPDFWIPRLEGWLEIKGSQPTARECALIDELRTATGARATIAVGSPNYETHLNALPFGIECAPHETFGSYPDMRRAVDRARSARFEFGEVSRPTRYARALAEASIGERF